MFIAKFSAANAAIFALLKANSTVFTAISLPDAI